MSVPTAPPGARALAAALGIVLSVPLLSQLPAQAAVSNGRIAFERWVEYDDENGLPKFEKDIFSANLDGTDEVNLTATAGVGDIHPAWSPDGTRIAFSSNRDGNYDLYTMAADGSDVRQVTFTFGIEYEGGYVDYFSSWEPAWSPDGTELAFSGYRTNPFTFEVFRAPVEATEETYAETMVTDPTDFQSSSQPAYSPDGTSLLYTQYFDQYSTDIWRIGVDGTGGVNLTGDAGASVADLDASWSSDGTRVTWISSRDADDLFGQDKDVYVAQADGSGVLRVTTVGNVEADPEFSPDGTQILYQTGYYDPQIWVVDAPPPATGARVAAPAATPVQVGVGGAPSWQPLTTANRCTIVGTAGDDVLVGTAGRDVICGLGGNDVLRGGSDRDLLVGGTGADTLYGGGAADRLVGGAGADRLDGGAGTDRCDLRSDTVPTVSCET